MIWSISREPDDRLAKTRISLGSVDMGNDEGAYIVFRGNPEKVVELLEKAYKEAQRKLPRGEYADKRGRPQG
jgi:hypothetical protein